MSPLSDFQRKKILNLFERLYDVNRDGSIEKNDFEEVLKKIAALHKWSPGDQNFQREQARINKIWEGLQAHADQGDKDGRISKEEWTQMWEDSISQVSQSQKLPDWQQEYLEFIFAANDTSDDGLIDRDEYTAIYSLFGFSRDEINFCFDRISEGLPDNKLTKADFERLWREYLTSQDASAKGNYLFGKQ